ncbi:MAG TPA: bifunctional 3-demethylubiquinol 3-O-methyltransferase/2-polyprenyl-6-hydroxyphenol methylase [Gammaproteobacteria bacterium]|jgi:2-polyprenyl-6-hydroxyphenyl methylase/3-demethylubiquinone-9 3-methyltransferase|nr:bifunctional 2-polyprenyl-6-hydroxyphenol methylase/3-demethylubiquinol 3-O-methyltransferase UbiG [Arenicellales bacterium]HCV20649.1 bifunctional 3-demethylubiquinol 3-O-methyltransferase/2-polyprenyl-6-hydroxyphenol methylase [Gammaproteobacteria bacterium]MDP6312738.1 bifunctional 2-polyprenyl-6-hydroxyphenol methylase/3-demethylubiquinol 3-O-methyltransferase UbiG [Arenicellales bacterium]MDP7193753.1 bifunctional 2-polyprenyl-6-hydroxyphenol methylase/3-demethylubiquinol 3-O-methyltrans|tara:strand:+ start:83 stop:787 length:705 start_codon:yes stop_codon:yes gene_type:complete
MDNIDPTEVAKFESLAARWWDPHSEFRTLHQINPLRLEYIAQRATLEGARVVDVGCGGGILSEALWTRGAQVTGLDAGQAPIAVAKLHAKESGARINYQSTTAESLADELPGGFDLVTCMELLEHVPDPATTVTACAKLLRPGGQAFFSTINRNAKSWLLAIVGGEYLLNLLPRGTHHYEKLIRPSELDAWARQTGLQLTEMIGMHYNPVSRSYRLGPGVEVNYIAHFSRPYPA